MMYFLFTGIDGPITRGGGGGGYKSQFMVQ